ncbi:unnamed protein product [Lupinus luteus]|uniref:S-protein homolog n=1 Tax=Lupinus luteus TaxID=3873 RepID=A0AAV1WPP0_LUPLU
MMTRPSIHVIILCLLLLLPSNLMVITTNGFSLYPRIHVYMTNRLPKGTLLTLHCKSKDDDLGVHYLNYNEQYTFSFHYNIFRFQGYTLFFCGFTWNGKLHWFEVYNWKRDSSYGRENLRWVIEEDGPCLFNYATHDFDICDFGYKPSQLKLV